MKKVSHICDTFLGKSNFHTFYIIIDKMLVNRINYINNNFKYHTTFSGAKNSAKNLINENEYKSLISRLNHIYKRMRDSGNNIILNFRSNSDKHCIMLGGYHNPYKNTPIELIGLIPYCGYTDISIDINNFLKYSKNGFLETLPSGEIPQNNKLLLDTDSQTIQDFIKCLNYSLKKLDERYGTYSGLVYRGGIFEENGKQYYSTSGNINPFLHIDRQGKNNLQFHIIKISSGHKISEFQKEFFRPNNILIPDHENEILLSPDHKYKEIFDSRMFYAEKNKMAEELYKCLQSENENYTKDDILKQIHVWQEIKD